MENILIAVENRIATITINRPSKLNALNKATIAELSQAIDDVENNQEVRVVILTGSGEKAL
ncbi:enoyl-CoA hydratase [Nonlabens tegetincola]|uniref:Enoyl-CoA hydratase n=1 Tax=Nonlabens tegetincola TaxID=323273 RepID=A0A090PZ49_9FLAO|nr:enoyl-CoA hydratase [Nonlabens tegetincola]